MFPMLYVQSLGSSTVPSEHALVSLLLKYRIEKSILRHHVHCPAVTGATSCNYLLKFENLKGQVCLFTPMDILDVYPKSTNCWSSRIFSFSAHCCPVYIHLFLGHPGLAVVCPLWTLHEAVTSPYILCLTNQIKIFSPLL